MTTVTLYPTDDAHVDSNNASTNYGTDTLLDVGDSTQYTFISFDISSIPSDATINSATLYFIIASNTGTTPLSFRNIDATFSESTITWNNKPSVPVWTASTSGNYAGTGGKNAPVKFHLTEVISRSLNYLGLRIHNYLNTESVEIRSKEYDSTLYLYVDYTAPPHRYVKTTGDDTKDGKSWTNAWATINKVATTVADGTTVHIGHGTYNSEPANNDIAPVNAASLGIKYKPETADTGAEVAGSVTIEKN